MDQNIVIELQNILANLEVNASALKVLIGNLSTPQYSLPEHCPKYTEKDGVIRFSVTSNGLTGEEWISRLESKGYSVDPYVKSILLSEDFVPTNGVKSEIVVLKGILFTDGNRTTKNIRAEARKRNFIKLNAETACLIREEFTDEELKSMGLYWLVVMHNLIDDSDGDPSLLSVSRDGDGRWLSACYGRPAYRWSHDDGFAFALPQVS